MWFYGMVGDDQFRDPWLDEALRHLRGGAGVGALVARRAQRALGCRVTSGAPIGGFADDRRLLRRPSTTRAPAALLAARQAAGAGAFDAAVRCYVDANAWSIARPRTSARRWPGCGRPWTSCPGRRPAAGGPATLTAGLPAGPADGRGASVE